MSEAKLIPGCYSTFGPDDDWYDVTVTTDGKVTVEDYERGKLSKTVEGSWSWADDGSSIKVACPGREVKTYQVEAGKVLRLGQSFAAAKEKS